MSEPRQRRHDPDRTDPNRSFSGAFSAGAPDDDPILRSVHTSYRIVAEQLRRGRQIAQDASARFGASHGGDVRDLAERALRFYGDLYTETALFWLDASLNLATLTDPYELKSQASAGRPAASSSAVPLEVASKRPARISLTLNPDVRPTDLRVHTMRSSDSAKPPLMDVSFEARSGGLVLKIRVPDDQPSGVYHGVVCAARDPGTAVGTLTIDIRES